MPKSLDFNTSLPFHEKKKKSILTQLKGKPNLFHKTMVCGDCFISEMIGLVDG